MSEQVRVMLAVILTMFITLMITIDDGKPEGELKWRCRRSRRWTARWDGVGDGRSSYALPSESSIAPSLLSSFIIVISSVVTSVPLHYTNKNIATYPFQNNNNKPKTTTNTYTKVNILIFIPHLGSQTIDRQTSSLP